MFGSNYAQCLKHRGPNSLFGSLGVHDDQDVWMGLDGSGCEFPFYMVFEIVVVLGFRVRYNAAAQSQSPSVVPSGVSGNAEMITGYHWLETRFQIAVDSAFAVKKILISKPCSIHCENRGKNVGYQDQKLHTHF